MEYIRWLYLYHCNGLNSPIVKTNFPRTIDSQNSQLTSIRFEGKLVTNKGTGQTKSNRTHDGIVHGQQQYA